MKIQELTLPPFAFVDGGGHDGDLLSGRTVILHVRSASVVEIFDYEDVVLNENVVSYKFGYVNRYGVKEKMVAALHYCATIEEGDDRQMIIDEILAPAAQWYREYCTWEDNNIAQGL